MCLSNPQHKLNMRRKHARKWRKMDNKRIYMYGMILVTNSFLLKNELPQADEYAEIQKKYFLTGGETGTASIVLASLGCQLILDGTHQGIISYPIVKKCFDNIKVDTSLLTFDKTYEGCQDYVFIDKKSRTIFGSFGEFFKQKHWNSPRKEDIASANVIGLDPFFYEESLQVARYCKDLNKKFATIDCEYDSELNQYCEINAISRAYLKERYPGESYDSLFKKYTDNTDGLIIFTMGSDPLMYGRKGEPIKYFPTYHIQPVSTLGAGDSFKAGTIYALNEGMTDEEIVSFASATAATACLGYPIELNPPTLEKIKALQSTKQ